MLNLNNDEFLNQQLILVSEERDELIDQLEQLNQNEPILKEKMRREFNRKLVNEKSKLQEEYNNKEVYVSKMRHEIVMLRSQIENEQSEKEQIKLSL
jgi:hypothetical protein